MEFAEIIVLTFSMLGLVVGAVIVICVVCCLVSKRKVKDNNNDKSVQVKWLSNIFVPC